MKKVMFLFALALIGVASRSAEAQDMSSTNPKYVKVLTDTAGVKMLLVTLPPGAKIVTHTHPVNVGYVLKGGLYKWTYESTGKTETFPMKAGDEFHGPADPPHHSWNAGKTTIQFLMIEKY
jgi:quercetin dioxygenase-like cupin family protein